MGVGADGAAELTVRGKMEPGDYVLPGDVSSQFVSGLLFALPLLPGNSTLTVQQPVESESYIRMTIEAIAASGIEVQESNAFSWRIPGHQQYKSHSCHLNGDYSQAAVLCCAGALGHDITVTHLSPVTTQGDRAILRHLMALGATVEESDNHIRVKADKLHGATLDMHDCPDIAPILALTAQLAEGGVAPDALQAAAPEGVRPAGGNGGNPEPAGWQCTGGWRRHCAAWREAAARRCHPCRTTATTAWSCLHPLRRRSANSPLRWTALKRLTNRGRST